MKELIKGETYSVMKKIKIHTKPLIEVCITLQGTYKKTTSNYYIFDSFKVNKNNVLHIGRM